MATAAGRRILTMYTVDSFSSQPFSGNPAAVCCLSHNEIVTDEIMQKIAAEMNISETAFVRPNDASSTFATDRVFTLRWFTPTTEVALCGHATLATAAVLFHVYNNKNETVDFETLSGVLRASRSGEREVTLDFPISHPQPHAKEDFSSLISAVVGTPDLVMEASYQDKQRKLLLRLHDNVTREQLDNLQPDMGAMLKAQTAVPVRGVIVTLSGLGGKFDFLSRYFGPWVGIPEDPVTGSAHTVLASYWCRQLSKTQFHARQCSARGGTMKIDIKDERVFMTGDAVVMMHAQFML